MYAYSQYPMIRSKSGFEPQQRVTAIDFMPLAIRLTRDIRVPNILWKIKGGGHVALKIQTGLNSDVQGDVEGLYFGSEELVG